MYSLSHLIILMHYWFKKNLADLIPFFFYVNEFGSCDLVV